MSWTPCPVCTQNNPASSMRCSACGADFGDPDVMAMMSEDASNIVAPKVAPGSLAHSNFLGISEDGLVEGSALRKLAIIGSLFLIGAFLLPISIDFGDKVMAWKALEGAPAIALLFPVLAAIMGIASAIVPLQSWQRAATLLAAGLVGLTTLPFLGSLSGSPEALLPLIWLGVVVSSWGLVLRCYDSQSMLARKIAIAGAVLAFVGFFLPLSAPQNAVPLEMRFYFRGALESGSAFTVYKTVFNRDPMVFFSSIYLFLPMFLLPLGAALAWATPSGAWDKMGMVLRPVAWLTVLYVPIGFALFAFNLLGENSGRVIIDNAYYSWNEVTNAALLGRLRLLLLGSVFALWASLPSMALLRAFGTRFEETPAEKK
ncbi:MAG: hypothetical protein GY811_25055 [Myxococcales bacterium]|nr:hypothetical protein [Myxococcales bacterium]